MSSRRAVFASYSDRGPITKTGNSRVRWLLMQAALCLMRVKRPETAHLREWAEKIAARRGKKIAVVALAHRLAGILFAMMRDWTQYQPPQAQEKEEEEANQQPLAEHLQHLLESQCAPRS